LSISANVLSSMFAPVASGIHALRSVPEIVD
jgi:hypothetical protein